MLSVPFLLCAETAPPVATITPPPLANPIESKEVWHSRHTALTMKPSVAQHVQQNFRWFRPAWLGGRSCVRRTHTTPLHRFRRVHKVDGARRRTEHPRSRAYFACQYNLLHRARTPLPPGRCAASRFRQVAHRLEQRRSEVHRRCTFPARKSLF